MAFQNQMLHSHCQKEHSCPCTHLHVQDQALAYQVQTCMKALLLVSEVHIPVVGTPVTLVSEGKFPAGIPVPVGKLAVGTPVLVYILVDAAYEGKPAEDMMVAGMLPADKPAADKLVADKPVEGTQVEDRPVAGKPAAAVVAVEQLVLAEQPVEF